MARKMTLHDRATAYSERTKPNQRFTWEEANQTYQDFIAGWRARGRADRVTKAVVDAAKIYCGSERGKLEAAARDGKSHWARLLGAVAKLERAKGRK